MTNTKEILLRKVEQCMEILNAYLKDRAIKLEEPIIFDNAFNDLFPFGGRKSTVLFCEVDQTDLYFSNYCVGLEMLGHVTSDLKNKYYKLRNECSIEFGERQR